MSMKEAYQQKLMGFMNHLVNLGTYKYLSTKALALRGGF